MDALLNFHMVALRGVLEELVIDVPNADDATFESQVELLREIRRNILAHKTAAK